MKLNRKCYKYAKRTMICYTETKSPRWVEISVELGGKELFFDDFAIRDPYLGNLYNIS